MFNSDTIIFFSFLAFNLGVGLWYGRGIKTLRQFAIGDKQFPTYIITLTILATWTSGSAFRYALWHFYAKGLIAIIEMSCWGLSLLVLSFLAIRAGEFLNHLSIAESIGSLYGTTMRRGVACIGIVFNIIAVTMQFKVGGDLIYSLLGLSTFWSTILVSSIVIFYATLGGIRSVTFTDLVQFVFFSIFIPFLGLILWFRLKGSMGSVMAIIKEPIFSSPTFMQSPKTILIFVVGIIVPNLLKGLYSPAFQRLQMTKNVYQAKRSLLYAACIWVIFTLFMVWIVLQLKALDSSLTEDNILSYVLEQSNFPGFKGIMAVGLMAMVMSTADSYLNTTAVLFANDLIGTFSINWYKKHTMKVVRTATLVFGTISLLGALTSYDVYKMGTLGMTVYLPIIAPPLVLALFGFRPSERTIFIGVFAGVIGSMSWLVLPKTWSGILINESILGVVANLIFLLGSHYLLGESGVWKGIKQPEPLILQRKIRKAWWQSLWEGLYSKSLQERLLLNLPKQEGHYFLIGLYAFLTNFLALYGLDSEILIKPFFQGILYILFLATALIMTWPAWPPFIKKKKLAAWAYPLLLCYALFVVTPVITALVGFKPLYLGLLVVHTIVAISALHGWVVILIALLGSVVSAILLISIGMPLLPTYFSWQIGTLFGVILLLILFTIVAKNNSMMQKLFIQNDYMKRSNKLLHDNMLKLKSSEMRFLRHLSYGKYNGLNKVHAVSENIIEEMKAEGVSDKYISKVSELSYQIKTNAGHLDQMIGYMENRLDIYRKRIVVIELLQTIKKRYIAMQKSIKLLIQNKCKKDYFSGDIEKVEEMLAFLINRVADVGETPYIFITVEPTNLVYTHAIEPYKAIAFSITTGATEPTIKQEYRYEDRSTTLSVINTLVDQHYGYLDDLGDGNYVLVLPQNIKSICPSNKEETPRKIANWVLVHAQRVEGYFWAKLLRKECANGYNISRIRLALSIMKAQHGNHPRKSKHLFYTHSIHVAIGVMDCTDDESLIIASLLHDRTEDANMNAEEIEPIFGKRVGEITTLLINQKSKFKKYKQIQKKDKVLELSLAGDPDAILIKLHDRRHNICTLSAKESHKRVAKAIQTLDYYVPQARKLGFNSMANSLEELCKLHLKEKNRFDSLL